MTDVIERELHVAAPIERVWQVITDPAYVAQWFGSTAEIDLRPGGDAVFGWTDHGNAPARVERVEPPHVFSFRWMREHDVPFDSAGYSTLVEFTLAPDGAGTRLRLVESGLTRPGHQADNSAGWDAELAELVALLEPALR
jgi:uncharacterized protein YndB with AHSA1/START domain